MQPDTSNRSRKSYVRCCVFNCTNSRINSPNMEFYCFSTENILFPAKRERREAWLNALKLVNDDGSAWVPTRFSRICSSHFIGNQKIDDPRSPSYNPTIFPSDNRVKVNPQQAIDRYKRRLKRDGYKKDFEDSIQSKKLRTEDTYSNVNESVEETMPAESVNPEDVSADVLFNTVVLTKDVETQVDFMESQDHFQNIFMCNRYFNSSVCEVETQACIPLRNQKIVFNSITIVRKNKNKQRPLLKTKKKNKIPYQQKYDGKEMCICKNKIVKKKLKKRSNHNSGFYGFISITKQTEIIDLAGVSFTVFDLLVKVLRSGESQLNDRNTVSYENRLLIFLIKMKCGLTFSAISVLFDVHRSTVSRIFYATLNTLAAGCKNFVFWPQKEVVQETIPACFKLDYEKCRVIIDATEFVVEQPPTVELRVQLYSHYKKGYRLKIVVGCTPSGYICIVSKCHGGRATDAQITISSGLLNLLEPGDVVLADKGFPQIKTMLDESQRNILVVMPPFLHNQQFTEDEVDSTYKIAKVRIHIERIMQRIRTYKIVDKFSIEMLPYCDNIIFMCCVLVNLQPPIIQDRS